MQSRTYECRDEEGCLTYFEVFDALWSDCSLVCPVCQGPVKHMRDEE